MTLGAEKPLRATDQAPLFLYEVVDAAPRGARVLDAGCGPGTWPYQRRSDQKVTGFDIKFPPGPPAAKPNVSILRGNMARIPVRDASFDLTVCHYVLEHVTELEACCDELTRVTKMDGTLYLSVPRSASFDDRLYRFAGYFAKYALGKFNKRIEHQQRFDLQTLLDLFYARGMVLSAHARIPAGFSWMNDPRTKPLQGPFVAFVAWLHRTFGIDLARDANYVLTFRKTPVRGARRVTHVCKRCGEHVIIEAASPWPPQWVCPWCGHRNPLGRTR